MGSAVSLAHGRSQEGIPASALFGACKPSAAEFTCEWNSRDRRHGLRLVARKVSLEWGMGGSVSGGGGLSSLSSEGLTHVPARVPSAFTFGMDEGGGGWGVIDVGCGCLRCVHRVLTLTGLS